ncbi:hypothetical protein [Nocardioides sp. B-3]|uniref:hypothetical protein n=1 Tax=Nocardioides sp. B-3 TaxID=2895565 RepID=UPI0021528669|nr:hypothetical protein [Nocardioides sp. B-3]UUZ58589.1 hypothetical protein LP418_20890 [Nocardioides sp. B-3]
MPHRARGGAGRVGARRRRQRGRVPGAAGRHRGVRRCAASPPRPRSSAGTGPRSSSPGTSATRGAGRRSTRADHIAVGRAVLDAARDAGNRWIFPEQLSATLEPWGGVKAVWAAGSPESRHGVDTTDTFDAGVASLEAHRAYIDGLGWENWDPREFLEGFAR